MSIAAGERPAARAEECCAVVVNYRCAAQTLECLASLQRHVPALPVLVVDNGSGDDSAAVLAKQLSGVAGCELWIERENRGFGAGCNRAFEVLLRRDPPPRHALLINPDALATAGFLDELLATAARHPEAGIVGGRVLAAPEGGVYYENGRLRPWTLGAAHCAAPRGRAEFEAGFVTGALMLVAGDLLAAGLRFDERYFMYVEDLDLCCEVRERGRSLWVTTRAEIHHCEGGSQRGEPRVLGALRARQMRFLTRNKVYFARKRLPIVQRLVCLLVAALAKPLAGVVYARSVRFLPGYYTALWEGLRMPR